MLRRLLLCEVVCIGLSFLINTESDIGARPALALGVGVGLFLWIFGEMIK